MVNNRGQQQLDYLNYIIVLLNNGSRDKKYFKLLDVVADAKNLLNWKRIVLACSKAAE